MSVSHFRHFFHQALQMSAFELAHEEETGKSSEPGKYTAFSMGNNVMVKLPHHRACRRKRKPLLAAVSKSWDELHKIV